MSEPTGMTLEEMKRFLDCFNRQDLDGIMERFADDCVFEAPKGSEPSGRRIEGREAIRAYFGKMFRNVPDLHFGDDRHWVTGDFGVSEWTLTGSQPDGSRFAFRGCDHFHFRGGRIVRKDTYQKIVP